MIATALIIVILIAASLLWRVFVLAQLWDWYVVPVFGLDPISVPVAIGLSALIGLTHSGATEDDGRKVLLKMFLAPLVTLVVGFAFSFFV